MQIFPTLATVIIALPDGEDYWVGRVTSDSGESQGLSCPMALFVEALQDEKGFALSMLDTSQHDRWEGRLNGNEFAVVVRPTQESDGIPIMAKIGGPEVPLPLPVMQHLLLGTDQLNEGLTMPTLYAMSEDDGFVVTLMLSTETGLYVRYSSQWLLITDNDVVDGLSVNEVDAAAVEMFDQFDRAGQLVHVTAMPQSGEAIEFSIPSGEEATPVAAAAVSPTRDVPMLSSADDLPAAIEAARDDPDIQWWVERRALALGLQADYPWS